MRKSGGKRQAAYRPHDDERALRHALVLEQFGNQLADAGRFEAARESFARAIEASPLMVGTYYDLVRCRPITRADDSLVAHMRAALTTLGLDDDQRIRIHLAIGKAAEDLGDYEIAMKAFDAASVLRSKVQPFDAAVFDAEIGRLAQRFSASLIAQTGGLGIQDQAPILILGLPRSGTTLVEQIISAHPGVAGGGELSFWNERGAASLRPQAAGTSASFLARAASDYLAVLRAISTTAIRVTDKMPFNVIWAALIQLACPGATLIYCRRCLIDTALSIHQTHFNPGLAFPTGGLQLVRYVRSIDRLAAHWRAVLPAKRFIEVQYEELVTRPERAIPRLVDACDLPWHEACLSPEKNARLVRTPSRWQARQPINAASVGKWRKYEPWLGDLRALTENA